MTTDSDDDDDLGDDLGDEWTADDDRALVGMVLGKLRLSERDWAECARSLGKRDCRGVGRRWRDLVGCIELQQQQQQRRHRRPGPAVSNARPR